MKEITCISVSTLTTTDVSGNNIVAIPPTMPYRAKEVVPDSVGPQIVAFTLDVNIGNLTLDFDEMVNVSSFNSTVLTLLGAEGSYNLTTVSRPTISNMDTVLMITLSQDDLNGIKGQEICNGTQDCFVSHGDGLIGDTVGNISAERDINDPIMASTIGTDFTIPMLNTIVLFDHDSGIVILQFSETIYGDSVNFMSLELVNADGDAVTATGSAVINSTTPQLAIQLANTTLDMTKIAEICNRCFNCFVRINSGFATDYVGNAVASSFSGPVTPTGNFVRDITGPTLVSFGLDLQSSILSLVFDEPVRLILPSEIVCYQQYGHLHFDYITCTISGIYHYKHHS